MIVSHDVAGGNDNYRTIFLHVRNGADNDCDSAWKISVPTLSGNTGPGGKKGTGTGADTRLHIYRARRDPTDRMWYFFDPYGIYAGPPATPPGLADAVMGTHARYP